METYKLGNMVREFTIHGIPMIGNVHTGSVIGLDDTGIEVINQIKALNPIDISCLNENQKEMISVMESEGFFNDYNDDGLLDGAYVHLTDNCNLHCVGCYSFVEERNKKKMLSYKEICSILKQLKDNGVKQVVFSGGEPFLRNDIDKICKYAKCELEIEKVAVITNGTMDQNKYYPALKYIDELSISVDGYNEKISFIRDKGIMPKVLETIQLLKDKVSICLIATLHAKNICFMEEYLNLSKKYGVKVSFSIFTVDPTNSLFKDFLFTEEDLANIGIKINHLNEEVELIDMPTRSTYISCRNRCEVGHNVISVAADGTVYPCHMLHQDSLKLGNLLEDSLYNLLNNKESIYRNIDVDNIEECKECEYKYLCGGGCRGRSWLYNKNFNKKDAYCTFIKKYYEDLMNTMKCSLEKSS